MTYDYKKGKERVEEILDNEISITEGKIPSDDKFTFTNGYFSWVTAIFVDVRDSSKLFSKKGLENKKKTAKLIRAFTSEIIEILRGAENLKEIGIRGDCVYAIYNTPDKPDVIDCADKTFYVNTYLNMLNKMLQRHGENKFKAGIGMATAKELVIKAGRSHTNINSKVWIGEAVSRASNLSSLGEKEFNNRLVFSNTSYKNIIDGLKKRNTGKSSQEVEEWFKQFKDEDENICYHANIIKTEFNDWIESEM